MPALEFKCQIRKERTSKHTVVYFTKFCTLKGKDLLPHYYSRMCHKNRNVYYGILTGL